MNDTRVLKALLAGVEREDHLGGQIYISQNGKVIMNNSFGFCDQERNVPFGKENLMLWRSAGKPLTAVAVASLVSSNILSFEDILPVFFPELEGTDWSGIKVSHLLTHTAGLLNADKLSESLSWDDMIERIIRSPVDPDWVPGEKAGYHIAGTWYLLAELCNRLTKTSSYSDWIRRELLIPLGLTNTYIGIPKSKWSDCFSKKVSPLYITSTKSPTQHPYLDGEPSCTGCRPGGNTRGTAEDLGHFYEWTLGLHEPLSHLQPYISDMTQPKRRLGMFDLTFKHKMDWGMGFMVNSNRYGLETVPYGFGRYASGQAYGHGGAQCSSGFADPKHGLVVAWIVNGMPGEIRHQRRVREINEAAYIDLGITGE